MSEITELERDRMEHCIGFTCRKIYTRGKVKYFKPYRNFYDAGGSDISIWEGLSKKGYAKSNDKNLFWITNKGLEALSDIEKVYIYSKNACCNVIDAKKDVIDVLLEDYVEISNMGCPAPAESIARRARLPKRLVLETLHYLRDKLGYVTYEHFGGIDEEGFPHCYHGWSLTQKWENENKKIFTKAWKEKCEEIDRLMHDVERL